MLCIYHFLMKRKNLLGKPNTMGIFSRTRYWKIVHNFYLNSFVRSLYDILLLIISWLSFYFTLIFKYPPIDFQLFWLFCRKRAILMIGIFFDTREQECTARTFLHMHISLKRTNIRIPLTILKFRWKQGNVRSGIY